MRRTFALVVCVLATGNGVLLGATSDDISQMAGISGGLCVFPRFAAADQAAALELAKRPAFVVHVLSSDAAALAGVREAADAAGLLGRSLYAEKAGGRLPHADRLVDLLVATDLRDADLTAELRAEWLRVLTPRRGAAVVGRAKAAGGRLSAEALAAWTKDLPLAKVVADETGTWAVLRADLPAGSDAWSHRCHGPDNSQVSSDATLKPPFLTQWWGMPRQEGFWGTTVVADDGRMFTMRGSRHSREGVFLTARSLTNGVVLWQKPLVQAPATEKVAHGGYIPGRSCMVAQGDRLYLIDRDGVVCLNAETGEQADRVAGPKKDGQVKWLALSDGLLAMLAGEPDVIQPISYQTVAENPSGRELAVYEKGRQLWHETLGGDVDERFVAVRGGRVYSLVQGVGLEARELRTGKSVWLNSNSDLLTEFRPPDSKKMGQYLFSQPGLMAVDDVLILRAVWAKGVASVSAATGELLWKRPEGGGRALTSLAVNGVWLGGRGAIDLKTGEAVKGPRFISSGCGPTTATPASLISCFGAVSDIATGRIIRPADLKSPCDVGSLVCEGIMVTVPSECGCNFEVKGYRALAAAGGIEPHAAPPWQDRMTVLDTAEPAALAVTDADWPTYRRDARRSAASAATVGDQLEVLWRWKPAGAAAYADVWPAGHGPRLAPDMLATAPVAAAGRVWFASHDGTIRCMQADSGKEVWTFATGGMLFAPPTVCKGRLLAGGGDGRIYCLDATTGRLLWQLLAGPADRRVFWFGHMVSTWPLLSGVAVQDGVAYAVAGYQADNGLHAYAIDPVAGKVLWEKHDAGSGGQSGAGAAYSCGGQVALGAGRMWLSSSTAVPGSFDLATGDWKPIGRGSQFCSEAGVLADKWVIEGGRRLSETQDTLGSPLGGAGFVAYAAGEPPAKVGLTGAGTSLPAWDAELVLMPPKGVGGPLAAVPTAKLLAWLAAPSAATQPRPGVLQPKGSDWVELTTWKTEAAGTPVAFALAKDQAVVAYVAGNAFKLAGFRRTDGSTAWTIDLPEQPAMNRLAIDRDGRVLVALCDGSLLCAGRPGAR